MSIIPVVRILCVSMGLQTVKQTSHFLALGRPDISFWLEVLRTTFMFISIIPLTYYYGIKGTALGVLIGNISGFLLFGGNFNIVRIQINTGHKCRLKVLADVFGLNSVSASDLQEIQSPDIFQQGKTKIGQVCLSLDKGLIMLSFHGVMKHGIFPVQPFQGAVHIPVKMTGGCTRPDKIDKLMNKVHLIDIASLNSLINESIVSLTEIIFVALNAFDPAKAKPL